MLNGKEKEDFEIWMFGEDKDGVYKNMFYSMPELYQNASFTSWFNEMKYEGNNFFDRTFDFFYKIKTENMNHFDVCVQAIESCNDQYNLIISQIQCQQNKIYE